MKPKKYLQKIGIEITPEVEAELKTSYDVDAVMDGSYVYETNVVDINTFHRAQEYCHDYFNGNITEDDEEYVDLSLSFTTQYSHYIDSERPEDKETVELDLADESRYYEVPEN